MRDKLETEVRSLVERDIGYLEDRIKPVIREIKSKISNTTDDFSRLIETINRMWTPPIDLQELRQVVARKQPVYMLNVQGVPALQVTNVDTLEDFSLWMNHELTGQYICSSKDGVMVGGPSENPDAGFLNESFGGTD